MFTEKALSAYAKTLVRVGLRVQPGDRILVRTGIHASELVPYLAEEAYRSGAVNVDVLWRNPTLEKARFTGPDNAVEELPYDPVVLNRAAERGDSVLTIVGDAFDVDWSPHADQHGSHRSSLREASAPFFESMMSLGFLWTAAAFPGSGWARRVFPSDTEEDASSRLWDSIVAACRVDGDDPVADWDRHLDHLDARKAHLNSRRFTALEYSGPDTDLRVGLSSEHWWNHPGEGNRGRRSVANIPTEEVSTSPDARDAEGTVRLSRPLVYAGSLIDGAQLTFRDGEVSEFDAASGADALGMLLDVDEGSRRLGEVALVPISSRVARLELIWHEALFDENDASHIALGAGYPFGIRDGLKMNGRQLRELGLNQSAQHVDAVVGSSEVTVVGVDAAGNREPLIEDGEWAFHV